MRTSIFLAAGLPRWWTAWAAAMHRVTLMRACCRNVRQKSQTLSMLLTVSLPTTWGPRATQSRCTKHWSTSQMQCAGWEPPSTSLPTLSKQTSRLQRGWSGEEGGWKIHMLLCSSIYYKEVCMFQDPQKLYAQCGSMSGEWTLKCIWTWWVHDTFHMHSCVHWTVEEI